MNVIPHEGKQAPGKHRPASVNTHWRQPHLGRTHSSCPRKTPRKNNSKLKKIIKCMRCKASYSVFRHDLKHEKAPCQIKLQVKFVRRVYHSLRSHSQISSYMKTANNMSQKHWILCSILIKHKLLAEIRHCKVLSPQLSGLILGLRPANERRRYFVTRSLIGWVQA